METKFNIVNSNANYSGLNVSSEQFFKMSAF